VYEHATCLIKT